MTCLDLTLKGPSLVPLPPSQQNHHHYHPRNKNKNKQTYPHHTHKHTHKKGCSCFPHHDARNIKFWDTLQFWIIHVMAIFSCDWSIWWNYVAAHYRPHPTVCGIPVPRLLPCFSRDESLKHQITRIKMSSADSAEQQLCKLHHTGSNSTCFTILRSCDWDMVYLFFMDRCVFNQAIKSRMYCTICEWAQRNIYHTSLL